MAHEFRKYGVSTVRASTRRACKCKGGKHCPPRVLSRLLCACVMLCDRSLAKTEAPFLVSLELSTPGRWGGALDAGDELTLHFANETDQAGVPTRWVIPNDLLSPAFEWTPALVKSAQGRWQDSQTLSLTVLEAADDSSAGGGLCSPSPLSVRLTGEGLAVRDAAGASSASQASAIMNSTACAAAVGDPLFSWGAISAGRLGLTDAAAAGARCAQLGSVVAAPTPLLPLLSPLESPLPPLSPLLGFGGAVVVEVAAGGSFSLARLSDGSVYLWGTLPSGGLGARIVTAADGNGNGDEEGGDGTLAGAADRDVLATESATARRVVMGRGDVGAVALAAGCEHALILLRNGEVFGVGSDAQGQLGGGARAADGVVAVAAPAGVIAIGAGCMHSLFLESESASTSSPSSSPPQSPSPSPSPPPPPPPSSPARVWGCGKNDAGQLTGDEPRWPTIRALPSSWLPTGAVSLAAGRSHSLAVQPDGKVCAWGSNAFGQLGPISDADGAPLLTTAGISKAAPCFALRDAQGIKHAAKAVMAGHDHSLVLSADGRLFAFGAAAGSGAAQDSPQPREPLATMPEAASATVLRASAAATTSIASTSTGAVFAWGTNELGQLGKGCDALAAVAATPARIDLPGVTNWTAWRSFNATRISRRNPGLDLTNFTLNLTIPSTSSSSSSPSSSSSSSPPPPPPPPPPPASLDLSAACRAACEASDGCGGFEFILALWPNRPHEPLTTSYCVFYALPATFLASLTVPARINATSAAAAAAALNLSDSTSSGNVSQGRDTSDTSIDVSTAAEVAGDVQLLQLAIHVELHLLERLERGGVIDVAAGDGHALAANGLPSYGRCARGCGGPAQGECVFGSCRCFGAWAGDTCEAQACDPACVHGRCIVIGDGDGDRDAGAGDDADADADGGLGAILGVARYNVQQRCECDALWEGEACNVPICPDLDGVQCSGRGACDETDDVPACICNATWSGEICETPKCDGVLNNCNGNGACSCASADGVSIGRTCGPDGAAAVCACAATHTGEACQLPCPDAGGAVCSGSGVCSWGNASVSLSPPATLPPPLLPAPSTAPATTPFTSPSSSESSTPGFPPATTSLTATCTCAPSRGGVACEVPLCPGDPECGGSERGRCERSGTRATCVCSAWFGGSDCAQVVCARDCGAHGKCVLKKDGTGTECSCDAGWHGDGCSDDYEALTLAISLALVCGVLLLIGVGLCLCAVVRRLKSRGSVPALLPAMWSRHRKAAIVVHGATPVHTPVRRTGRATVKPVSIDFAL